MSVKASSQVSMLDITDAYSVTLTSEAFAFVGNTSGAPSGLSCATQVIAYCGTQRCSKVTIGTVSCPSGISASLSNNGSNAPTITFTTTATITAACEATIPVTVDGVTINKKFSFAVAKTGAQGPQGPQGVKGVDGTLSWNSVLNGVTRNGSVFTRTKNSCSWDAEAYSVEGFVGGCYASAKSADTSHDIMFGLNTDPKANASYNTIDYAFHFVNNGLLEIWENGIRITSCGDYTTDTVCKVLYDGQTIKYYKDSKLFRSVTVNITIPLYFDSSFYDVRGTLKDVSFGPCGSKGDTGNGVSSSTVDYQVSSSGTTIPTGTWQPSVPSVSPGQYLWTRTILKYTNGSSSSASYSVGRMGTNGTNGSNGRGIKSTVVTYQAGSSGTSAPTGIWTSSVPATSASAPYLWSKTDITYTDNTPSTTTYSVGSTPEGIVVGGRNLIRNTATMPGVFGADTSGASAMGTAAYQSDGSALVTNSNSNFRFVGPEFKVAAGEVYTVSAYYKEVSGTQTYQFQITYNDNTLGQSSGVGTKQNMGDGWIKSYYTFIIPTGCTKIKIWLRSGEDWKLYTHSYYVKHPKLELGNKATDWTPAPEDTEAEISALTTRVANAETSITKSNEAIELRATKTEVAQTYATKTDVNNIQVGGRNLLQGTHKNSVTYIYPVEGMYVDRMWWTTTIPLNGDTYTLSFWAKSTVNGDRLMVFFYNPSNIISAIGSQGQINNNADGACEFTLSTTLTKYWVTYTIPKGENSTRNVIIPRLFSGAGNGTLTLQWEKLELGNKATDWTPAPEDLETRVTTAESSIKQTADKISLVVKSGDSESNMVLTDKVCELVANNINLRGRITISGLNSDTQTKINNGNDAKTTLDNKSAAWDGGVSTANSVNNTIGTWCYNNDRTIINGGKIAAGTITANKLAIGDFTNYCTVNANVPETMLPTSSEFGGTKVYGPTDTGGLAFVKASNSQPYLMFCDFTPFLFKPGEQLYFYGNILNYSSTACSAKVGMWLYDSNKGCIAYYQFWAGTLAGGTWNKVSGSITITNTEMTNVKYFVIGIETGNTGHIIGAGDLICKKKAGGELIVDGAITADKLNVTSLSAITANLGSVNAGDINIGGGKFHVDPSGNLTATSATISGTISSSTISGGSININNQFKVDTSGNLTANGAISLAGMDISSNAEGTGYIISDYIVLSTDSSTYGDCATLSVSKSGIDIWSITDAGKVIGFNVQNYDNGVYAPAGNYIYGSVHTNMITPSDNATYSLGDYSNKIGWSNIYLGNASNTWNGLRIFVGTEARAMCGINADGRMTFGNTASTMYYNCKSIGALSSGVDEAFRISPGAYTANYNSSDVYLFGRRDSTSKFIGSYLVYARTYGSAANVVVTNNGVLGRSTSSSKRYKHDIREFSVDEISCLYDLPLKKFKYNNDYISKDDEYYDKDLYGFIVEDLDEVLPISVQHNLDDDAEYTIPEMWNNNIIVPCLLKLIQDLNNRLKKVEEGKEN